MAQIKIAIGTLAAALALFLAPFAYGGENPVAGEKLDSGLGKLPHYREWTKQPVSSILFVLASRVPGEKLDSGLGNLPPYREWADNLGFQHVADMKSAGSR